VTGALRKSSCVSCPSYGADGGEQIKKFGKHIGAPVCLRYGHVLGKPGAKPKALRQIAETKAGSCPTYGHPLPPTPERADFQVAFPDPAVATRLATEADKKMVGTCNGCANLIEDSVIAKEWGWPVAVCAAKGTMIFPNKRVPTAQKCDLRSMGAPRDSVMGVTLDPLYTDAFGGSLDPVKEFFKTKATDPTDYPTDRPLTLTEEKAGIRAVRKIEDPNGYGDPIYLPIYDIDQLPEELRGLVPRTGDDEHPELYVDHQRLVYMIGVMWLELDETPMLWGPAGVGKTELYRHMAWLMCLPFHRISITGSSELDDLAGKMHVGPDPDQPGVMRTYFEQGRLPKAWTSPGIVCLDEPNTGPPEVWQFIRPLTDNSKQLVLDMAHGQRLDRHADAFLGMAANPAWDVRNIGTAMIGDADANRLMHINVTLPPEDVERRILIERAKLDGWEPPPSMLNAVMAIAKSIRDQIEEGSLPDISWGVRPQIKVIRALRWFPPLQAYRRSAADYLDPQKQDIILDQVKAQIPDDEHLPWR
jgi:MoxR-like ATPase